jgi:hypothetical protein
MSGNFEIVDLEERTLSQIGSGLLLLLDSTVFARKQAEDPWEFSVEWPELQRLGWTCNHSRWLIHKGMVRHAHEITSLKDEGRRFVPCTSLNLSEKTCFILTEDGCRLARQIGKSPRAVVKETNVKPPPVHDSSVEKTNGNGSAQLLLPKWDRDRRQLRIGANVVKEFKVPAINQEIVLAVFEEEHWPPKIDDPLPHKSDIDPQRRLHDTINSLNRRQRIRLLHFGADGLGRGIRWDFVEKNRAAG